MLLLGGGGGPAGLGGKQAARKGKRGLEPHPRERVSAAPLASCARPPAWRAVTWSSTARNSNGEYLLDRTLLASDEVKLAADPEKFVGAFKAGYFGWVNIIGLLLQLFVVSRVFSKLGVRAALFFLPGVAFIGYSMLLTSRSWRSFRVAKIAENSLDYSIEKTSFQALFLVASRVEKYVGKTVIDTLLVRSGDVLSAALVYVAIQLTLSTKAVAAINLTLIVLWFGVLVFIGREHKRRSEESEELLALEPRTV